MMGVRKHLSRLAELAVALVVVWKAQTDMPIPAPWMPLASSPYPDAKPMKPH
jgi:hypothetical protein